MNRSPTPQNNHPASDNREVRSAVLQIVPSYAAFSALYKVRGSLRGLSAEAALRLYREAGADAAEQVSFDAPGLG